MNREEFLKRCETIWDAGLATHKRLVLLDSWIDAILRFEHGQMNFFSDFIASEVLRTDHFHPCRTGASDEDGYALVQMAAILNHPCQQCAEDLNAWWTRSAFCEHKSRESLHANKSLEST